MPERVPAPPVQLTVHSIDIELLTFFLNDCRKPLPMCQLLHKRNGFRSVVVAMQQIIATLEPSHQKELLIDAPFVSSTFSFGGFSPEFHDSGLFSCVPANTFAQPPMIVTLPR